MSRRVLWLACSALSLGFVVVSCSTDGDTEFSDTAGTNAGGAGSASGGTKGSGGTKSVGGTKGNGGTKPVGGSDANAGEGPSGGTGNEAGTSGTPVGGEPGSAGTGNAGEPGTGGAGMPGEGGAGGAPVQPVPCENFKGCKVGEYCQKPGCDQDKVGVCVMATRASDPVCGCDGVTYYSGALANVAEIDVRGGGVCSPTVAVGCEDAKCPDGLTCGRAEVEGGSCADKIGGVCWQLPKECPKELAEYNICGTIKCTTLCDAVTSGEHAVPGGLGCAVVLP